MSSAYCVLKSVIGEGRAPYTNNRLEARGHRWSRQAPFVLTLFIQAVVNLGLINRILHTLINWGKVVLSHQIQPCLLVREGPCHPLLSVPKCTAEACGQAEAGRLTGRLQQVQAFSLFCLTRGPQREQSPALGEARCVPLPGGADLDVVSLCPMLTSEEGLQVPLDITKKLG